MPGHCLTNLTGLAVENGASILSYLICLYLILYLLTNLKGLAIETGARILSHLILRFHILSYILYLLTNPTGFSVEAGASAVATMAPKLSRCFGMERTGRHHPLIVVLWGELGTALLKRREVVSLCSSIHWCRRTQKCLIWGEPICSPLLCHPPHTTDHSLWSWEADRADLEESGTGSNPSLPQFSTMWISSFSCSPPRCLPTQFVGEH